MGLVFVKNGLWSLTKDHTRVSIGGEFLVQNCSPKQLTTLYRHGVIVAVFKPDKGGHLAKPAFPF